LLPHHALHSPFHHLLRHTSKTGVGQISGDGTQMSLPANDPSNPGAMVVYEKQ